MALGSAVGFPSRICPRERTRCPGPRCRGRHADAQISPYNAHGPGLSRPGSRDGCRGPRGGHRAQSGCHPDGPRPPDGDGIDLTRRIRAWSRVPIIVLSARGREEDKVAALDEGADDYLTKPFGVNGLLARIRAAMRRAASACAGAQPAVLVAGTLRIDQARREVTVGEREIRLTPIEYRLLVFLAGNAGKVLTHRQILKEVWGPPYVGETHNLRVFMAALRRKVEQDPARPQLLLTEPGVGYRMKDA